MVAVNAWILSMAKGAPFSMQLNISNVLCLATWSSCPASRHAAATLFGGPCLGKRRSDPRCKPVFRRETVSSGH